jgi:ribosomal protein L7Ae-like RNA K-turn-binding protein
MERPVMDRVLRLVGLGARSRGIVIGVEQVREAAKKDKVVYVLVAPDAARNSVEKLVPLLSARGIMFVEGPSAAELGAAVGKEQTAAVGIVDRQLARGIRALVESSPEGTP